jgi:hypothetical protein
MRCRIEALLRKDIGMTLEANSGASNLIPGGKKGLKRPSRLLGDMRWVYENPAVEGEQLTAGQAQCRALQRDDSAGFLKMLSSLEKTHSAGLRASKKGAEAEGGAASAPGHDVASERVEALIEELLAGWERESQADGKENGRGRG